MPIYVYEPLSGDCPVCEGRFEALQAVDEPAYERCPDCTRPCRRVIGKPAIRIAKSTKADEAAKKGFTTYKRAEEGVWEKIGGEGADAIVGTPEDRQSVKEERKKPKKTYDVDKG